jgi:hypothetical protein
MKKLLMLAAVTGMLAVGAPTAQAEHTGYRGGCAFTTINDTTPDGQLGGQNTWNGEVDVLVIATDAADTPAALPISAECELFINGVSQGIVATATQPGVGFAVGGGTIQFTAETTDVVTLCDNVVVDGEPHVGCGDAVFTPIVPQPVIDLLDQLFALLTELEILLVDPIVCPIHLLMFQVGFGVPGVFDVNEQGDVFLFGDPFWDCPPYDLFD